MRTVDLSNRKMKSSLKHYPFCLVLDKADRQRFSKFSLCLSTKYPLWPSHLTCCENNDFAFDYSMVPSPVYDNHGNRIGDEWPKYLCKMDHTKGVLRLYFRTKAAITFFMMQTG